MLPTEGGQYEVHKRPYLQNMKTLDVITVQNKAWMDSVGCVMRCDLVLGPMLRRSGEEVAVYSALAVACN